MKKKVLAALMCAAMTVGMLAGCGGNSTAGNSSSGAGEAASGTESADSGAGRREMDVEGDDVTTLEVWTFIENHQDFYTNMAEKWNEENPDKKVKLVLSNMAYDDMHNKLSLALESGEGAPDVVDIELGKFPAFMTGDIGLKPLNSSVPTISEPSVSVTLYQGLPKSDKMDSVVQKAVEMGVTRIVPMLTQRCVSRPDQKSAQKKVERWQKISVEAAKQCGRGILPPVSPVTDFSVALRQAASESTILFFYEGGGQSLQQCIDPSCKAYSIFIGPEGGFSEEEVQFALDLGAKKATLGPRILRTETAPIAALTAIMLTTGNMT